MSSGDIGAQLERILTSPVFSQSGRLSRFLRVVVEASRKGQAGALKEYSIGVEVFDRGKDFDPRIDPIVRVQAAKLRSKLLEYYATEGARDPIVISIPKGSYAPEIRAREHAPAGPAPAPADRSHIAVLPFVNMSSDPENEYFSDGLTEELINRLASIPDLQVVARTSAFRFKGRNEDLREVGAKLNVGTVMEGSVRRAGDQLRVTAQLIDVQSGYHLFSRTYQREYKGVFDLQDELAQAVVDEIAPLSGAAHLLVKTRTVNLDAYHAYLHGTFAMANRFHDYRQGVDYFREALRLEPDYAPAWAGLAQSHFLLAWFYQMPAEEAMPIAREAALRTLELDPDSAQGLSSLGLVECGFEWRWDSAESRFRRAIEVQPGFSMMYPFYAFCCLLPQGRREEACQAVERALSLDPFNPLCRATATYVYGNSARHEDALRQHALGLEVNPLFPPVHGSLAMSYEWSGRLEEAIAVYRRTCELARNTPFPMSCLGHALAISGQHEESRQILRYLLELPSPPEVDIASVYLGLRDADETLRWLEAAAEKRNVHLLTVPSDARFDWIRPHPRFQKLLHRMGLQTAATSA